MSREAFTYRRAARARVAAWQRPFPPTVQVVRYDPPEIAPCRWPSCRATVEWVVTLQDGLLPMTHPLTVLVEQGLEGRAVVTAASADCHLARCPEAPAFLRQLWAPLSL